MEISLSGRNNTLFPVRLDVPRLLTHQRLSAGCGQFETTVLSSPAEAAWVVTYHLSLTSKVRYAGKHERPHSTAHGARCGNMIYTKSPALCSNLPCQLPRRNHHEAKIETQRLRLAGNFSCWAPPPSPRCEG